MRAWATTHPHVAAPGALTRLQSPATTAAIRTAAEPLLRSTVRRPTGAMGAIFVVLLLDLIGFSIVFPLYAHLFDHYASSGMLAMGMASVEQLVPLADHGQRTALFGGLMGALYSLLQVVAAPWWGRLSDRIGRRPVLLASISGNCLAYLLWVFAGDFALFLLSRLIAGAMTGNTAVAHAAVADLSTPANRGRCMGRVGMAFGLGLLIGPLIGGLSYEFLPRLDQVPLLAHLGAHPFSTPALVALCLGVTNLVVVLRWFPETRPPADLRPTEMQHIPSQRCQLRATRMNTPARTVRLGFALHVLLFSGLEATLVFLAWDRCGYSVIDTLWLFVAMGATSAVMQGVGVGRLGTGTDQRLVAGCGLTLLIPGYLLIGSVDWWPSPLLLITGMGLLACGSALVFPAFSALASLHAGAGNQGQAMGALRAAGALGRTGGPLLAALLYFVWRPGGPYVVAAIGILVPLWLLLRLGRGQSVL